MAHLRLSFFCSVPRMLFSTRIKYKNIQDISIIFITSVSPLNHLALHIHNNFLLINQDICTYTNCLAFQTEQYVIRYIASTGSSCTALTVQSHTPLVPVAYNYVTSIICMMSRRDIASKKDIHSEFLGGRGHRHTYKLVYYVHICRSSVTAVQNPEVLQIKPSSSLISHACLGMKCRLIFYAGSITSTGHR